MATTARHRTSPERHLYGEQRGTTVDRLGTGFSYLTLNPAPRLREVRERLGRHDAFTEAWRTVGRAIREALEIVGQKSSIR
jgi:hypothetical protein